MSQHVDAGEQAHVDRQVLIAYVMDGQALDVAALNHLGQCPECSAEIAWWRSFGQAFAANRDRQSCPSVETLQAYALDQLTGAAKRTVKAHIKECVQCAAEVSASREFLREDVVGDVAVQQSGAAAAATEIVRRIVAAALPADQALNLALRGLSTRDAEEEDTKLQVFTAEGVEISLRHKADEAVRGTYLLYGEIGLQEAAQHSVPIAARLLHVKNREAEAGQAPVAEASIVSESYFEFEGISPGTYQIELLFPDRLIVVASVVL